MVSTAMGGGVFTIALVTIFHPRLGSGRPFEASNLTTHVQHVSHVQRRVNVPGFPLDEGLQHANGGAVYVPTKESDTHVLHFRNSLKLSNQPVPFFLRCGEMMSLVSNLA